MNKIPEWRSYVSWDDKEIAGFFSDYRWLSNYEVCEVYHSGIYFNSSEAAYQAAKTSDPDLRRKIAALSPAESRGAGQVISCREIWPQIKLEVMYRVCLDKFTRNEALRKKLLATGSKHLEETNAWSDLFWGTSHIDRSGMNHLGKILMRIRDDLS